MGWFKKLSMWISTLCNLHQIGPRLDDIEDDLGNQIADLRDVVIDHLDPVPEEAGPERTPGEQAAVAAEVRKRVEAAENAAKAWYEKHHAALTSEEVSSNDGSL